jgi:hypothetical protein
MMLEHDKAHAVFHVIVENQIAENLESALRAIVRLRVEGLDRHDAIHAVASVLFEHVQDLINATADAGNAHAVYDAPRNDRQQGSWIFRPWEASDPGHGKPVTAVFVA